MTEVGPQAPNGAPAIPGAECVRRAMQLVRHGLVVSLNLPLDIEPIAARPAMRRTVHMDHLLHELPDGSVAVINDDTVEFPLQGSTHWDSFAHFGVIGGRAPGVYLGGAGIRETSPRARARTLGIDLLAAGIVARGVLLDMVSFLGHDDPGWLPGDTRIGRDDVERYLRERELRLERGDIVLVYTGYEPRLRAAEGKHPNEVAGVDADTLEIWAAAGTFGLVADTVALEPAPARDLALHVGALTEIGLYLGELWALESLAIACREHGVHEFLVMSAPLNISGAYGSPANALAVL